MRQGRADSSGPRGQKVEPRSTAVNPGGVANIGSAQGNHTTDNDGFKPNITPVDAGRGYSAPPIGGRCHKGGSQGKY